MLCGRSVAFSAFACVGAPRGLVRRGRGCAAGAGCGPDIGRIAPYIRPRTRSTATSLTNVALGETFVNQAPPGPARAADPPSARRPNRAERNRKRKNGTHTQPTQSDDRAWTTCLV